MNWRLTVAYEGTLFEGFQRQRPGRRTVQGVLEEALEELTQSPTTVRGASRTDSGVHAQGQVVAFRTGKELAPRAWIGALNDRLPEDVVILSAQEVHESFDPRRDALGKTYRYLLDPHLRSRPIYRRFVLHAPFPLDLEGMRKAAGQLTGSHDFKSFSGMQRAGIKTERTVSQIEIKEGEDGLVALEFTGNGFLYHMVRNLTGTLLDVGRGKQDPLEMAAILQSRDRSMAGSTAPARGLTLVRVYYPPESVPGLP